MPDSSPHSELVEAIRIGIAWGGGSNDRPCREARKALRSLEEQFDTERRRSAELRLRFRHTLRDEGWRDEDIEELLVEAERASNPASEPKGDWRNLIDTHG